ncbi:DUF1800 family protein [Synechococcus sp. A10-1-5-9]|uniref:DUF1800 family protein n=1 Tax=Synechococcus sp. A10-1-5-9 TaxID=3392295 RepID=UPI0039EA49E8
MVTSVPNCKALPRDEKRSCKRQQTKDLQQGWLENLQASGPAGREAWQVQLWLGLFAVNRRQLGARPGLLTISMATIREHLDGGYGQLLEAMLLDPALQISLNGPSNHRRNPNENLARELLELFSLGEGNYSEGDVKEAARALTGYRLKADGQMELMPRRHDPGPHTILGRTEAFEAPSLAAWLAEQPATARHIARRVWRRCIGTEPSPERLEAVSTAWRAQDLSLPWLMQTLASSPEAEQSQRQGLRLRDPLELVVRSLQLLGSDHPDAIAISLRGLRAMGQAPFEPPSVKGWPVNEEWLNLRWLQARRRTLQQLLADEEVWDTRQLPSTLAANLTDLPPLALALPAAADRDSVAALFADPVWQLGLSPALR